MRGWWTLAALLAMLLTGCVDRSKEGSVPPASSEPPQMEERTVTLVAAGDNLIHDVLYNQAAQRAGWQGYNFGPAYEAVAPYIQQADIAVLNQETVLADELPPASYPRFNSPAEVGEEMARIGFDVINHANNHIFDKGEAGVMSSLAFWDTQPVLVTGIYRNELERAAIPTKEVGGVSFAFLGYTQFTNGLSLPAGSPCGVQTLSDEAWVEQQVRAAAAQADVVVVSVHWGVEGTANPTAYQKEMAAKLTEWGADLIIGTHPHVLQPCQEIPRSDGTSGYVVYSLGNFVSAQNEIVNMPTALLQVTFVKDENGVRREAVSLVPVVTHYGWNMSQVQLYPLSDYSAELAAVHGIRARYPQWDLDWLQRWYQQIYPEFFGESGLPPVNTAPYRPPASSSQPQKDAEEGEQVPDDQGPPQEAPTAEEAA